MTMEWGTRKRTWLWLSNPLGWYFCLRISGPIRIEDSFNWGSFIGRCWNLFTQTMGFLGYSYVEIWGRTLTGNTLSTPLEIGSTLLRQDLFRGKKSPFIVSVGDLEF